MKKTTMIWVKSTRIWMNIKKRYRCVPVIMILIFLSSCDTRTDSLKGVCSLEEEGLSVLFSVKKEEGSRLYGILTVENTAEKYMPYSNKKLYLNYGDYKARARIDSPASYIVDVSSIVLEPGVKKSFKVYFDFGNSLEGLQEDTDVLWIMEYQFPEAFKNRGNS